MKKTKGFKRPEAKKLPSGSWFCRVRVDGKDICITKETQKEAEAEAMAVKYGIIEAKEKKEEKKKTLSEAIDAYIEMRRGSASPSTIYAYERYKANCFRSMMKSDIYSTTDDKWQAAIRREAKGKSPKYVANVWGLVASAIFEETGKRPNVKLPAKERNQRPYLEPDQVETFVSAIKGESVEIPALLELSSLRRSEMLAVRWSDVDFEKKIINIRGAKVYSSDGMVHKKQNKTKTSTRSIPIIPPLMEALKTAERKSEYVVTLNGSWIYTRINEICQSNGLPKVGNHGLRHSFASLAYHLQIPEKIAMEIGGWADDGTMRKIYTHLAQNDIAKRAEDFSNFFDANKKTDVENDNENGNEKTTSLEPQQV